MAEFLIYNKTHWYDLPSKSTPTLTGYERNQFMIDTNSNLSTAQKIKAKDALTLKYAARQQSGDIVEARRDGGPRGKLEEEAFIFLQIPGINLKDAKKYCVSDKDFIGIDKSVLLYKRKYYMDMTGLIPDSNKNVNLTNSVFDSRLKVKI